MLMGLFKKLLGMETGMTDGIKFVDPDTLESWIANGSAMVVDVRESHERAQGYIGTSVSNPLSSFDCSKVPVTEGRKLVFHCQMGRRCGPASEKMRASGYPGEIFRLSGGFSAWVSAGKKVVR